MAENDESDALVSVIIPTYERPEYLAGAIETARGQTYENIEVVVVNDGSAEPYADEIVAEYPKSVTCVRHEENKGLSAARNTGIRNASGEYVAFLDDDDRWHETKIARQVSALEGDETVGLVTCLVAAITPDRELVRCETSAPSGDCSETMLVANQIGTPSRVLVRQDCFDNVETFDESLPTKQDWDFYLRLCQEWNVAAVADHLCFRTIHESMSSSPESARRDNQAILNKHEDLLRSKGYWEQAQAEIEERVGRAFLREGDLRTGRKHFREALRRDPTMGRVPLYLLTFIHPALVSKLRTLKRGISIRRRGWSRPDPLDNVILEDTAGDSHGDD